MPSVQIKDVPEETCAVLKRRAADAHQSLQEYLRTKLIEEASRPTVDEVLARANTSHPVAPPRQPITIFNWRKKSNKIRFCTLTSGLWLLLLQIGDWLVSRGWSISALSVVVALGRPAQEGYQSAGALLMSITGKTSVSAEARKATR